MIYCSIMVCIIIIVGCSNPKQKSDHRESTASTTLNSADTEAKKGSAVPMVKIHPDTAAKLVSNYLLHSDLTKIFKHRYLGGTIQKKYFQVDTANSGIIFWFCYRTCKNPEFFLALEQLKTWSTINAQLPSEPASDSLIITKNMISHTGISLTQNGVKKHLFEHRQKGNDVEFISKKLVQAYIHNFDSIMKSHMDKKERKYCNYNFSYCDKSRDYDFKKSQYVTNTDFQDFLNQTPKDGFIRYYLGFNEHEPENRIRVILFSVDKNGKPITKIGKNNPIILQKSWPPPPN